MKYQSLKIFYMSGTGNSFRAATWMKETAERKNIGSELEQIYSYQRESNAGKKANRLLGIVFPTYAFTTPWSVIRHVLRLPLGKGQHAFAAATKGALMFDSAPFRGFEGSAAYLIVFLLMIKGYKVRGVMGLDMPANMINVHSGLDMEDARKIIGQARVKADFFIKRLLNGEKALSGALDLLLGLIVIPLSLVYTLFIRFFFAKLFFASDRCSGCGLCAKSCPKAAIKMVGRKKPRPYWKLTCENCMRCMAYCPNRAIEASHLFAVALIFLITASMPSLIFEGLSDILKIRIHFPFTFIIRYLYALFVISFAYFLFMCLIRIPLLNRLFKYATLTHFYRRYHEPDTSLGDITEKV